LAFEREAQIPDCPSELGPGAKREWERLVGELGKLKLLTNRGAYGLWAEATEAIQKYGTMVKSPSGYPIQSRYVSIANRQAEIMVRISSEFGFTPASRSRISTPSSPTPTLFDRLTSGDGPPMHRHERLGLGIRPAASISLGCAVAGTGSPHRC
jgi:P27 family predicted phage terminase small subunit